MFDPTNSIYFNELFRSTLDLRLTFEHFRFRLITQITPNFLHQILQRADFRLRILLYKSQTYLPYIQRLFWSARYKN
ncbi:unnamed protein product [Meloidogyne enterolobii]|uniref:Uncharacterized protein n=1 Tax=Meloidogyne enterolobii TaxID=390850 RepID=A0ACB1AWA8_MELEN